jgi:hypothetical protein
MHGKETGAATHAVQIRCSDSLKKLIVTFVVRLRVLNEWFFNDKKRDELAEIWA